jgi:hypothetical protein
MIGEPHLLFGTMTLRGTRGCAVGACPLICPRRKRRAGVVLGERYGRDVTQSSQSTFTGPAAKHLPIVRA